MDYFIVFGTILLLFLISIGIILKLIYQISDLSYELKLGKINCQKDLDRLEDRINQIMLKDTQNYSKEIEKLEKLQLLLSKIVSETEQEYKANKNT